MTKSSLHLPEDVAVEIRDPLLAHTLYGAPHGIDGLPKLDSKSNAIDNNGTSYRYYLNYVFAQYFKIVNYEYRFSRRFAFDKEFYSKITAAHYENSIADFDRIYRLQQEIMLSEPFQEAFSDIITGNKIELKRCIKKEQAQKLANCVEYAKMHKIEKLFICTDLFTFYAPRKAYEDYPSATFTAYIPLEDIIIYDEIVNLRHPTNRYCHNEFIVVNRNPDSLIEINPLEVRYDDILVTDRQCHCEHEFKMENIIYSQDIIVNKVNAPCIKGLRKICNLFK